MKIKFYLIVILGFFISAEFVALRAEDTTSAIAVKNLATHSMRDDENLELPPIDPSVELSGEELEEVIPSLLNPTAMDLEDEAIALQNPAQADATLRKKALLRGALVALGGLSAALMGGGEGAAKTLEWTTGAVVDVVLQNAAWGVGSYQLMLYNKQFKKFLKSRFFTDALMRMGPKNSKILMRIKQITQPVLRAAEAIVRSSGFDVVYVGAIMGTFAAANLIRHQLGMPLMYKSPSDFAAIVAYAGAMGYVVQGSIESILSLQEERALKSAQSAQEKLAITSVIDTAFLAVSITVTGGIAAQTALGTGSSDPGPFIEALKNANALEAGAQFVHDLGPILRLMAVISGVNAAYFSMQSFFRKEKSDLNHAEDKVAEVRHGNPESNKACWSTFLAPWSLR